MVNWFIYIITNLSSIVSMVMYVSNGLMSYWGCIVITSLLISIPNLLYIIYG